MVFIVIADDARTIADAGPVVRSTRLAPVRLTWLRGHRRPAAWVLVTGLLLLGGAALGSAEAVDADSGRDLWALLRDVGTLALRLRWQYTALVVTFAAVHYLAAAVAVRAASGLALPARETLLVQLAGAAANRLVPGGLGGSAVNTRFLSRRGLNLPAALGAVTCLQILGPVADLVVLAAVVFAGSWFGLDGASGEIHALLRRVVHVAGVLASPWTWLAIGVVVAAVSVWAHRRGGTRTLWTRFGAPARQLVRRPLALGTLLAASVTTTLVLALAFVASIAMVPGPRPTAELGALITGFMVGAAAGTAVPVPAGLGSTEAALIGVLVALHVPAGQAVEQVLLFRLITFWAPAVIGVLATRRLTRQGAL